MNLSTKQWGIVALAVATALIHIVLALGSEGFFLVIFLLNGLGYLGLAAGLYFVPQLQGQRALVRWALLGFTAVTFILYFVFNWQGLSSPIGLIDKTIELLLIILIWQDR